MIDLLQIGAAASLCLMAGWIASAVWTRSYWRRSMARQVKTWQRVTDAIFGWVEDIPVSAEALHRLKVSVEEAVSTESA